MRYIQWEGILRKEYRKDEKLIRSMAGLYLEPPRMKPISYNVSPVINLYVKGIDFILRTNEFTSGNLLDSLRSFNVLLTAGMFAHFCDRLKKSLQEAAYAKGVRITVTFICSKDQLKFKITGKI